VRYNISGAAIKERATGANGNPLKTGILMAPLKSRHGFWTAPPDAHAQAKYPSAFMAHLTLVSHGNWNIS
jgi:hypothetical protein